MFQIDAIHDGIFKVGGLLNSLQSEVLANDLYDLDWSRSWMPRDTAWYGDKDCHYTYSNTKNDPIPWTPELLEIKAQVEELSGHSFNSVLLNRYNNGHDSVNWHSDDEAELGINPVIASLSIGATRRFEIKHKHDKTEWNIPLTNGVLLLMSGESQKNWLHRVPKEPHITKSRLNLTFRTIK
tara:strand:- start:3007 stop:3552 length:546 start_codon:yes stop_codon:yes gene_type:complete